MFCHFGTVMFFLVALYSPNSVASIECSLSVSRSVQVRVFHYGLLIEIPCIIGVNKPIPRDAGLRPRRET